MKNHNQFLAGKVILLCTIALIIILGGALTFVYAADGPVANVDVGAGGIFFYPLTGGDLSLTVGGEGGFYFQKDFKAGETPSFQPGPLPDGNYKYDLRTIPQTEQEQMIVQAGSFQVENGAIIPPSEEDNSNE